jgi:hypothetical protein
VLNASGVPIPDVLFEPHVFFRVMHCAPLSLSMGQMLLLIFSASVWSPILAVQNTFNLLCCMIITQPLCSKLTLVAVSQPCSYEIGDIL